jgi:hypothetical protein
VRRKLNVGSSANGRRGRIDSLSYLVGGDEERGVADGVVLDELGEEVSGVAESDPPAPCARFSSSYS